MSEQASEQAETARRLPACPLVSPPPLPWVNSSSAQPGRWVWATLVLLRPKAEEEGEAGGQEAASPAVACHWSGSAAWAPSRLWALVLYVPAPPASRPVSPFEPCPLHALWCDILILFTFSLQESLAGQRRKSQLSH